MKKSVYFILLFFLLISLPACKTKKVVSPDDLDASMMKVWEELSNQNLSFEWYHATGDMQVSFEGFSMGAKGDIRIRKDSVILLSVKKFGLELARAQITQDSMYALNRLQGTYFVIPIDSVKNEYNVPFNYSELQEIIVGNHLISDQKPEFSMETQQGIQLKTSDQELYIDYLLDGNYNVRQSKFHDSAGRSFHIDFSGKKDFGNGVEHYTNRAYYYPEQDSAEYSIILDLDKIEIDQAKKIRFEIPSGYSRM